MAGIEKTGTERGAAGNHRHRFSASHHYTPAASKACRDRPPQRGRFDKSPAARQDRFIISNIVAL